MVRVGVSVLIAVLLAGCSLDKSARVPLHINAAAISGMETTGSVVEKRRLAAVNCGKAGYRAGTQPYYLCMRALIARDLQRMRERADFYLQMAAERHNVCMRRDTFRVARCLEI